MLRQGIDIYWAWKGYNLRPCRLLSLMAKIMGSIFSITFYVMTWGGATGRWCRTSFQLVFYSQRPCKLPTARFALEKSFQTIFSNHRSADYEARLASLELHVNWILQAFSSHTYTIFLTARLFDMCFANEVECIATLTPLIEWIVQ